METVTPSMPMALDNIAGQVFYQPEKFNSRMVLDQNGQKCILFAFSKGQELKTHTTPQPALLIMLEGICEFQMKEGGSRTLAAGEVIIIPAKVPHSLLAVTNFKMVLVK